MYHRTVNPKSYTDCVKPNYIGKIAYANQLEMNALLTFDVPNMTAEQLEDADQREFPEWVYFKIVIICDKAGIDSREFFFAKKADWQDIFGRSHQMDADSLVNGRNYMLDELTAGEVLKDIQLDCRIADSFRRDLQGFRGVFKTPPPEEDLLNAWHESRLTYRKMLHLFAEDEEVMGAFLDALTL